MAFQAKYIFRFNSFGRIKKHCASGIIRVYILLALVYTLILDVLYFKQTQYK